jgi:hypothetical protein
MPTAPAYTVALALSSTPGLQNGSLPLPLHEQQMADRRAARKNGNHNRGVKKPNNMLLVGNVNPRNAKNTIIKTQMKVARLLEKWSAPLLVHQELAVSLGERLTASSTTSQARVLIRYEWADLPANSTITCLWDMKTYLPQE